ncbi:MAG TPA: sigma-70 family RNA polymerase sigma factor [Thermoanaerobaculia bacterium]|jgi:RNA polymerase sigma-70 factor (ECF subfamily)|nr:sigma-70 family RNA polymerase sigma factor [Thermoanaerobaculia bacterium]
MELENQTAVKRPPFHDQPAQRDANPSAWPDAWLINAIRRDPPDEDALNALVDRYWKSLYARCRLLTVDADRARDLAQESWLRVMRARHSIEPDGHFQAYIATIATNLWRDMNRAAVRAGPMADGRIASLDSPILADDGDSIPLINVLADPHTLSLDDQIVLEMDLDTALSRLEVRLRDVLISRFIVGESADEIGKRYGRTEQAITGWIREAIRQMKIHLGDERSRGSHTEDR